MEDELRGLRRRRDEDQTFAQDLRDAALEVFEPGRGDGLVNAMWPTADDQWRGESDQPGREKCAIEAAARDQVSSHHGSERLSSALDGRIRAQPGTTPRGRRDVR